ncbi:MAG TPA: signal peptidase I, partial [Leptolinea sp.]
MQKFWRLPFWVVNVLLVISVVALWIAFAPINLGGQIAYVLVNGDSMEPGFHAGDLVIVRQAEDYQVGDIVTYRNADMGANVIHRIIGTEQDRFIIKGDNNSWIDGYQPRRDEVVGKLWIHLPKLGAVVEWVRTPINMALSVALIGGLFMVNVTIQKPKKNKKQKKPGGDPAGDFEMILYIFAALAVFFLALSIFVFSRPVTSQAENIPYEQTGAFSYSAAGSPGIYDSDSAGSGEPVFTKLTCTLNLGFTYTLKGQQLENIAGTQQFYAMIMDGQSGWKRTIPLTSDTQFAGNTYTSTATLDLCQMEALVAAVQKVTSFHLGTNTMVIVSHLQVGGKISGQEFTNTFEPRLTFNFDSLHFFIPENTNQKNDPLQTAQSGSLTNPGMLDATFQVFGLNLLVGKVRLISAIGLVISLDVLLILGLYFLSASKNRPEKANRIK